MSHYVRSQKQSHSTNNNQIVGRAYIPRAKENKLAVKEIKARRDGTCAKCNRELKEGWNIGWDDVNRLALCKPCYKSLEGQAGQYPTNNAPRNNPYAVPDTSYIPPMDSAFDLAGAIEDVIVGQSALLQQQIATNTAKLDTIMSQLAGFSGILSDIQTHVAALIIVNGKAKKAE